MIYSIRNEGETNERLLLKYKKLFFQSRVASKIKSQRYHVGKLTKNKKRKAAIVRQFYRYLNNKIYF